MNSKIYSKLILAIVLFLCIPAGNLFAQVSGYTFVQGAGTFTALTATYTQHTSGTTDNATYTNVPIGFTFNYNGTNYTAVSICNDGWIALGTTVSQSYTPLSSGSDNNVIAALAADLQGLSTGSLRSKTSGSSPNRTFTVEWQHYERYGQTDDYSFQIVLTETSNTVQIYYTAATTVAGTTGFQVGLRGTTSADYSNRTKIATTSWTSSSAGTANTDVMLPGGSAARNPNGLFTWTPVAMTYTSCTTTQSNTTAVAPGSTAQEIIGIQIVTTGTSSPLSATSFTVNANGTTAIADINAANSAKIYYTGTSSTFATTTLFGQNTPTIANFNITGSQTLSGGTNYFWLVYDIKASATLGNVVDGQCTSLTVTSARTPSTTAPAGNRQIAIAYCTPTGNLDCTSSDYISNVTFNNINNTTTCGAGGYTNYPASGSTTTDATQGLAYTFSLTSGSGSGTHGAGVWIDFNQNGVFTDAGEFFLISNSISPSTTVTSSITIPAGATLGTTRMRVRYAYSLTVASTMSCTMSGTYGETEDYTVNIVAGTAMSFSSCTTTQTNTSSVIVGTTMQEIIGIQIVTTGSTSPLSATSFTLNANGSTAIADINAANSAKIYCTGTSSTFATTTLFGQNTPTIANYNITGTQTLSTGTNYFWLVYDIKAGAAVGDYVDAECTSLTVTSARTPSTTAPSGSRQIQAAPMVFSSCTTTQPNTSSVNAGTTNQEVICVEVVTTGTSSPLTLTNLRFRTNGTTNVADIQNAKVFYTGTSSTFATTTQVGSTYATPPASGTNMDIACTQTLASGTNYFWLTYDVVSGALNGNLIDAQCQNITVGSSQTPSPQIPAGTRQIIGAPMAFSSCTTTQTNVTTVGPGTTLQEIIGIQIVTTGSSSPISATSFTVNANGTTAIADINAANSAKIYYTGTSSTFATTTLFGQNTPTLANFNITGSQALSSGTNYFWLVYDIKAGATLGDYVDAECSSLTVGSARTPSTTAPAGNRQIALVYCTSTSTSSTGYISSFSTTGGTSNITNNSSGYSTNGYGDFTAMAVSQMQGGSVNFATVLNSISGGVGLGIWVDWNQDGDFLDAGESMYNTNGTYAYSDPTGSFAVPAGATVGNTRMRVVSNYSSSTPVSCNTGITGETEDYTFTVTVATPMVFSSCTTTQTNTTVVALGSTAQEIIGIQIVTTGLTCPISVTSFTVNANGTTAIADINAANTAKIYYTGTSSSFATTTLFGQNTPTIASYNITGTQTLSSGTNYFWVVYDIKAGATVGDYVDAECTSLTVGSARTPSTTAPAGRRQIALIYCSNTNTTNTSYYINDFSTTGGTTNITNNSSGFSTNGYGDFTAMTVSAMQTTDVNFSITEQGGTMHFGIWIDWNRDGDFNDADEDAWVDNSNYYSTITGSFTVPVGATVGSTRMRVVGNEYGTVTACPGTSLTECEDYTFTVIALPACSGTPTGGSTIATPSTKCASETSAISLSGATIASGLTYQWQSSPNNSTWTDITGATSATYNSSATASIYYRCVITCTISGLSANSASAYLTVNNCAIIGNGTSSTSYPTPYRGSYEDARSQYIVSAAELSAQGLTPGSELTSLSFNVATKNSTAAFKSFTISIGHVNAGASFGSAAWKTPTFTQCFSANYTTSLGWNQHTFTTNFTWNGIDDIVVQACFNNTASTSDDPVYYNTVTNSICYAEMDAGTAGCSLAAEYTGSSRPNMIFNYNPGPPCSGTPSGGTAASTITSFCNTATPKLSISGYTYASGITFQWQYSLDGSTGWTDITGAQTATYTMTTAITQTTYFRCAVSCGANTGYSSTITATNIAESITATNSPVTVTCNSAANMTATASGGTINWYAASTGGTAVATGGSYSPTVTANTTYYCTTKSGGTNYNIGEATSSGYGYSGYYSNNYGLKFNAISAFTLVSVKVYTEYNNEDLTIQLLDASNSPVGSPIQFNNLSTGLNTLTLNLSIPIGNGYKLVSTDYEYKAYEYPGSFPYVQTGVCRITDGWAGSYTSTSYYYFYDWVISTACESSPRTPVSVIVSGGVTAPVCCSAPDPANNATNICPIATTISWDASTTACRTATGYKLYLGTNTAGDNIYNGLDVGLVTSYNLGTLNASDDYYWRIVPYNTAGNGSCATVWKFTTAANPGNICVTNMGTGVINVASLPYAHGNGTTKNKSDDLTSTNTVTCGSSYYLSDEDQVYVFTPALSGSININLSTSAYYTGLMLYDGCPLTGITCGATQGNCVAYSQEYSGSHSLSACVTAGITYYLVLDSWNSDGWFAYSDLTISAPSGFVAPNDLPCNATALTLGVETSGDNACTGGTSEPSPPSCWYSGTLNTVWFSVVCPTSGKLSIRTATGTLTNTQIAVYSGSCSAPTFVTGSCNDDISGCGSSDASMVALTGLSSGSTYLIRVDGYGDLIGDFTILAIDGNTSFPVTPGQDCSASLPTCNSVLSVPDPGYSGTGSICDFDGSDDCTGGDRAAVFYTIEIAQNGTLAFDIIPNDYSGGTPGDGTDYDFIVWKTAGSGTLASCSSIQTNSSIGLVACNYSYIDVTGLYPGGGANPAFGSGFDDAYEDVITVTAGDQYLLWVSNYSLSTSGFTLDYTGTATGVINYSPTPALLSWTGTTSAWTSSGNWGGCSIPSCLTDAVIGASAPAMPTISSNVSVKNITIDAGATLTINTGNKLTICGNFINNGTVVLNGTATLEFSGSAAQTYSSATALTIPNVIINNAAGVTLTGTATSNMTISGTLTLTAGKLNTANPPLLIINDNATVSGGSATAFVDGPMRKVGNDAFVFPTGDGTRWARLGITAPTVSSTFQAQYFATPYSNLTPMDLTQGTATLDHVSALEYWQLDRIAGAGNTSVTLYWNNASLSQILLCASFEDLSVAKWTGTAWTNLNPTAAFISGSCSGSAAGSIITQADVTSFSPFTFGSKKHSNPLPVELLSFTGKNLDDKNLLEWATLTETNNDYFIIEKSKDGNDFEVLKQVDGAGNSNTVLFYNETDDTPFNPVTYYKLKQVDFEGSYTYSDIISVFSTLQSEQPVFINLYPNPAATLVNLDIYSPSESEINVEIYDYLGMVILSEKRQIMKGNNTLAFDISKLADGIFYSRVFINGSDFAGYKKFVKE
jgi:hypothetical protein